MSLEERVAALADEYAAAARDREADPRWSPAERRNAHLLRVVESDLRRLLTRPE